MKKSILNLGTTLNKAEQKQINGGLHMYLCVYDNASETKKCTWELIQN